MKKAGTSPIEMDNNTDVVHQYENELQLNIENILANYSSYEIDRTTISQEQLNLCGLRNHNIFTYRGQFSPDYISHLLRVFGKPNSVVLDPFVGCGTAIFESAKLGLNAYGVDINIAAIIMAQSCKFINIPIDERIEIISTAKSLLLDQLPMEGTLFSGNANSNSDLPIEKHLANIILNTDDDLVRNFLSNVLLHMMRKDPAYDTESVWKSFEHHRSVVMSLPISNGDYTALVHDARDLPFEDDTIDLVLTSPPYINVFNYHQQYRKALELLGIDVLSLAKSEFGANRKHRGNRFLTVIQYILDMGYALIELKRVLRENSRAILIIGRESTVRGIRIRNDEILIALAELMGFELQKHQERFFMNQFGKRIYEDILHLVPTNHRTVDIEHAARSLASTVLRKSRQSAVESGTNEDLENAISQVDIVKPSPTVEMNFL